MRFVYNERKAAQASAYLLARHDGKLSYMVLLKLLYFADRRALVETGTPITGDRWVSMSYGPVLSRVLGTINLGKSEPTTPWYEYISEPHDYDVELVGEALDPDELSRYELRVLDEIDERYGNLDKWALVELTHLLPEWTDPEGSSLPIDPADVLRKEGKPEVEIARITRDAEEAWLLDLLNRQST
ncbi:MAG: Panacea domain-containing protein [Planctomycetota bacterium]|nr:Panacea domain-containing protein [Planctomycetota bacterium]